MVDISFYTRTTIPDFAITEKPIPMPKKIGPYKVESLFCKGGMSVLYLGHHVDDKTPLVIKILSPRYLKHKEMKGRFLKEAEVISVTDHPNIVKLYGQGKWDGGLYIAMEFIQGVSLKQFIQKKSFSQKRALEIVLQVSYALCHLHSHNVIHRDLKPENILITESGEIKVIDFGIAQLQGEPHDSIVVGTPAYMSPEQKENPESVSFASDIYSLGIITYELATGNLRNGKFDFENIPKGLDKIIQKAVEKDPKKRYQSIVDFVTDISKHIKTFDHKTENTHNFEEFSQTQKLFLPSQINLAHVDVGIAFREESFSGVYLDFFPLQNNRYLMIFFEAMQIGMSSYFYTGVLRGMVQMLVEEYRRCDTHPIKLLNRLNRVLIRDSYGRKFALSFLVLNPNKDLLSFISLGHNSLLHVSEGTGKSRILITPNPPLGEKKDITFLETADIWNPGDAIHLHSLSLHESENAERKLQDQALKYAGHSAKVQADRILENVESFHRSTVSICLIRIF